MAFSLSAEPPNPSTIHWTLVPLYSALAGMVRTSTLLPSAVLDPKISRSLTISGGRSSNSVPLILQPERPSSVSHVNTADWPRKTVAFSGAWSISGDMILYIRECVDVGLSYLEQWIIQTNC